MHDLLLRSTYLACVIGAVEHRLMSSNYLPIYKTEELCHFKYVVMCFLLWQNQQQEPHLYVATNDGLLFI